MTKMTKKGQTKIGIVFIGIMFVLLMSVGMYNIISEQGSYGVEYNNITGLEAFVLDNIGLIVLFVFAIAMMIYMSVST